jgi:hypothetical protein
MNTLPQNNVDTRWRPIEQVLVDYFRSLHTPIANGGGTAHIEVVKFKGVDDLETSWIDLEGLARYLADELSR